MWSILQLSFLCLFLAVIIHLWIKIRKEKDLSSFDYKDEEEWRKNYCLDKEFILFVQRKQWKRMKKELYGTTKIGFQGTDLDFYLQPFGLTVVNLSTIEPKLRSSTHERYTERYPYHELAYYRIWKSGNSNIRSLLFQYAYSSEYYKSLNCSRVNNKTNHDHNDTNCPRFSFAKFQDYCNSEDLQKCSHESIKNYPAEYIRSLPINSLINSRRFSFSFVRHPIDRFFSGMTEIEYRLDLLQHSSERNNDTIPFHFPFQYRLGHILRVKEFIDFIVLSSGSKHFLSQFRIVEILHIFPVIGTYLISQKLDGKPLQFYPLEHFDSSWKQLANDVFPNFSSPIRNLSTLMTSHFITPEYSNDSFYDLYHHRHQQLKQWRLHLSSKDPLNTTQAAKQFFSFISEEKYLQLQGVAAHRPFQHLKPPVGYTLTKIQQTALVYYRAICRMYLIDFFCFHYTLPKECQDLQQELLQLSSRYRQQQENQQQYRIYLESWWWRWLIQPFINLFCEWNWIHHQICWWE